MKITKFTTLFASSFALAAVLMLSACGDKKNDSEDILSQDTSLTRDLELANRDTAAQPQLQDVPVTPSAPPAAAPAQPAPAPRKVATTPRRTTPTPSRPSNVTESGNKVSTKSGGGEKMGTIASGSTIAFTSGQKICTNTNSVGDRFTATVAETVQGSNGAVIPAGAQAIVEVTSVKRSTAANDKTIELGFAVRSISFNGKSYNVNGDVTYAQVDRVRGKDNNDAKKVATGAVIGAIAGQIFGKNTKSTVIGGAVGAATGAATAAATANFDGCLPAGGKINIRLDQNMTVQSAS